MIQLLNFILYINQENAFYYDVPISLMLNFYFFEDLFLNKFPHLKHRYCILNLIISLLGEYISIAHHNFKGLYASYVSTGIIVIHSYRINTCIDVENFIALKRLVDHLCYILILFLINFNITHLFFLLFNLFIIVIIFTKYHYVTLVVQYKLEKLKHLKLNEECSICHQKNNKKQCILKCKHIFHKSCLEKWIQTCSKNNDIPTCPLCRSSIEHYRPVLAWRIGN